jgi:RNA polymerase sigma-70 factor, ECF subfamily
MNQLSADGQSTVFNTMSDSLLVLAAQSGDRRAFGELCERYSNRILPRIYRITRNWEDAEDVLQESFLRAFVHLKSFEGRSSFSSWFTRIAVNSALLLLRKRRRVEISIDSGYGDSESAQCWEPRDYSENPESRYARCEREELLRTTICRLPSCFRTVAELHHSDEYSTQEIACALGISVAAAKTRLHRARMRMRASLSARAVTP